MIRCTTLGDEELGRVYHADFFAWYAQRASEIYKRTHSRKSVYTSGGRPRNA